MIVATSAPRPTTPTVGRTARRAGSGTAVESAPGSGSQSTSTVSTAPGRPFRVNSPNGRL